ncbi:ABC-2 type transport system ATP-binding protein [Fontibacillus solani]|uniref:ABC-2 type transport system ATP-binding protein n=1 Tax=Fontibacillus solani TaxID=1572857 RepID=A0A7W3XSE1_9BACL|nr:ABC transporter ATP-binding protein [Fontibacillus solani]MBA9086451.1 ABC-2 type transport system ATP-binding protein [Fontibacillus solani]
MNAVEIRNVSKSYKNYKLSNVSFQVPNGYITGLIGPNGAGKSTIIKSIMGMVIPDQGDISVLGQPIDSERADYKEQLGYISDENIYYDYLTLAEMKKIVAPFYSNWDEDLYLKYMDIFELPARKKIKECSKGMKTKFSIALALSHHPKLLIMDEPTAGLDPVFRRELLELLADYILDERNTILFSTHLTTDLDRVADYVTFVNRGQLVFSEAKDEVLDRYLIVKGGRELIDGDIRKEFVGLRETGVGFEGLSRDRNRVVSLFGNDVMYQTPTLEEIMYYTAKGGIKHV